MKPIRRIISAAVVVLLLALAGGFQSAQVAAFNYAVQGYYAPVAPVNISGTITTGGSAQVLAAANANRRGWWIRNNSTGSLWVSDMTTAVQSQPSLEIKPGELYEAPMGGVSFNALNIIGSTTGQSYTGREW